MSAAGNSLEAILSPNSAKEQSTLIVHVKNNIPVQAGILNATGKLMQMVNGSAGQAFRFGSSFMSGMYIIEVKQGNEVKTIKGIKIK